ncbi:hypothetical protein A3F57_06430 [Candidatus Roizmanbacteria bacterium RIFCSPHIGHO2_12_FULL_36_11]|nr:MAG: hypothetical protein A3F57_06430 [Candidatus Roizmanbacteria bacterium RIFCSPHIGHO2_12_FULL_36_11]
MKISNFKFQIKEIVTLITVITFFLFTPSIISARERFFQVQSIDTMKYSRDVAREKLKDFSYDKEIETQVKNIAETGASHVAIATPYDDEFLPFLRRWVKAAREKGLNVWFRGNFSGWENWFDYEKFTDRKIHIEKTKKFILENPDLFVDGDIFTSCPECENGGPGDPRFTRDIEGYRNFLIEEYKTTKQAFGQIAKRVTSNYFSMNGDVARLIMDKETTKALDGVVTIDHYVSSYDRLVEDIKDYTQKSGGQVVLGEFGAPIPDIHGEMSEREQARWIDQAMSKLIRIPEVVGINYWTNMASSTQLWNSDHSPRKAVETISKYFNPINLIGTIKDNNGQSLIEVTIKTKDKTAVVADGTYVLPVLDSESVTFSKFGYISTNITVRAENSKNLQKDIVLTKSYPSPIYSFMLKIINFVKTLLSK